MVQQDIHPPNLAARTSVTRVGEALVVGGAFASRTTLVDADSRLFEY